MPENERPFVSVVIPTYNYGHYVCNAVESALAQTYPNLEVVVVDDGSKDDTQERLKKYSDKIRYIYKENQGLSAARNTGIKESKGEIIAFLDSDDAWLPEKIEEQIKIFEQDPEVGLVSCGIFEVDEQGKVQKEIPYKSFQSKDDLLKRLIERNVISGGSNAIAKKECFDQVGLFDETLRSAEDWDMWLRIAQHYEIKIVERPLVRVRVSSDNMSSVQHAGRMLSNEVSVLDKYFSKESNYFCNSKAIKDKAYSYRYFCSAWACFIGRDMDNATKFIFKSFFKAPSSFLNKRQGGLMIRILIEKVLRFSIPVNRVTKPLFNFIYKIHIFFREGFICFFKFIYFEPLFRSQCEKVGKSLWMEKLPYMVGKGRIIIGDFVRLSGKPNIAFSRKIYPDPSLTIGNKTFVGHSVRFAVAKEIRIGNHCYIAGGVSLSDNDGHPLEAAKRRNNLPPEKESVKEISIGDDVWIGREAVILKGVTIGDRSIVGARAIVVHDVPPDTVVAGNPAKEIKSLKG